MVYLSDSKLRSKSCRIRRHMNYQNEHQESLFPKTEYRMASFGQRLAASMIDGMLVAGVMLCLTYLNIKFWKSGILFIMYSLVTIAYKPWMEYRWGATLGKMALAIRVVGSGFQRVTLKEELRRVSFYLVPNILSVVLTLSTYFGGAIMGISSFDEYNRQIVAINPALQWLNVIVVFIAIADCFTLLFNDQNHSLHDLYAGTSVIIDPVKN